MTTLCTKRKLFAFSVSGFSHQLFATHFHTIFIRESDSVAEAVKWQVSRRSHALEALYNEARLLERPPLHPMENCVAEISLEKVELNEVSLVDAVDTNNTGHANDDDSAGAAAAVAVVAAVTSTIVGDGAVGTAVAIGPIVDLVSDDDDEGGSVSGGMARANRNSPKVKIDVKPVACKLEYDDMSGYIPFENDVSFNFL